MYTHKTRFILGLTAVTILLSAPLYANSTYSFQTLNNPGDPAFNQLLGVNNAGTIAGYFGDGTLIVNNGYTLSPPSTYTAENYPASFQTQVVAINNTGLNGGFWADTAGDNFGFIKTGSTFATITDPSTPTTGTMTNQILGINDVGQAAGFYNDASGNAHGYIYNIGTQAFTAVNLPASFNAVSVTTSGIDNNGDIVGFYTDSSMNIHGFVDHNGTFTSIDDPNGTNLQLFGLNNNGLAVGSYIDTAGENEGVVYDFLTNTFQTVDDPNASATAAFNVTGTFINGINDQGDLVGFYSDGANVDGFEATPTPEPATFGLLGIAGLATVLFARKRK